VAVLLVMELQILAQVAVVKAVAHKAVMVVQDLLLCGT
jgi:hypothetical protein